MAIEGSVTGRRRGRGWKEQDGPITISTPNGWRTEKTRLTCAIDAWSASECTLGLFAGLGLSSSLSSASAAVGVVLVVESPLDAPEKL